MMERNMRYLEVRRHTMRVRPGQHLSQAGVTLARQIGNTMGPFDRVITSSVPRAFETAIAMGFAVDEQHVELGEMGRDVDDELQWPASFAEVARIVAKGKAAARFAHAQAKLWRAVVNSLPDGGRALIITHGGIIEVGAVGCLPEADHAAWGPPCDYCEGLRLAFDGEHFADVEVLRIGGAIL
jgi:broad specificity phosphatase PhoE